MVVALFALSLVMILGGIASVVQGFPYVRLESGLAMVISGATAASAGAVLLGLAAVVMRLKRVEDAFGAGQLGLAPQPLAAPREIGPLPVSVAPAVAGAAGLAGLTVGAAGLAEPRDSGPPPELAREEEPVMPDLLPPDASPPAPRPRVEPPPLEPVADAEPVSPEEDLFAASPVEPERDERPSLRASLDGPDGRDGADNAQEKPVAEPDEQPSSEANPVVGTYSSGANTYVMFSDGTIQADTPRGRFTFGSLDELKAFVEAGGENDARGAA